MKEDFFSHPNNKQENWITYRDSIEFKRGLKNLEESDAFWPKSKALILAVALNIKKAAEITFDKHVPYEEIEKILSDLGIYFFRDEERELIDLQKNEIDNGRFIIGSTPNSIDEAIIKTRPFYADPNYDQKFGESMDFPQTSIDAFKKYRETYNQEVFIDKNSDERLTYEEKAFLFFRLSSENWESEIQWLEQIISAVKEYSPKIYREVMEEYSKSILKN